MIKIRLPLIVILLFTLFFTVSYSKQAPNPESIVQKEYVKPLSGARQPLLNRFDNVGNVKRLYYLEFNSANSEPKIIADEFLINFSSEIGLESGLNDLSLMSEVKSLSGTHIRYQQTYNGIPVFASEVLVNITNDNKISSMISDYKHNLENLPSTPSITSNSATSIANGYLQVSKFRGEPETELVYFSDDNEAYLTWKVLVPAEKPLGDWQIFVDAISGNIVKIDNIMCFVDGSGYSFDPSPIVSGQSFAFRDSGDNNYPAILAERFDVTLENLNPPSGGLHYLSGPYVNTQPTSNRAREADPDNFHYDRQSDYFEEVVVYYQINHCYNYYESLGFTNIMDFSIGVDVNGTTDDNSWYSPWNQQLTFGSGGVDDGEDGDVVIHEYGHATQHNQVPSWGQVHEGGAMGEGFGDYLSVSHFTPVSNGWDEAQVFDWDANPMDNFWPGRRVDENKHYPEDMTGSVHADGEIWSRCFWDMQAEIGYDTTLQLLLEAHFYLTGYATFEDAANAVVQADNNLYGGTHLLTVGQAFVDRGILLEMPIELNIYHLQHPDIENVNGPYTITATIGHTNSVDSTQLYYKFEAGSDYVMVDMSPTGNPDEYTADIPGPGMASYIYYYMRVVDDIGIESTLPENAPAETFSFYVGPDLIDPVIVHEPIQDFSGDDWPPTITAQITDNLGIDSAYVEFRINGGSVDHISLIQNDTTNIWDGQLTGTANPGDFIEYFISAVDLATAGNMAFSPDTGYYGFYILEATELEYFEDLNLPVPNSLLFDTIYVADNLLITEVDVYVDITHDYIGDLYYKITAPNGNWVILHNREGGSTQNRVGWYDDDFTPSNPDNMLGLNDSQSQGNWVFFIGDLGSGGTGTINSWGVRIRGLGLPVSVDDEISPIPTKLTLSQNYPNPFNPSTNIDFSMPSACDVSLEIFDILGRSIANPVNGFMNAGNHTVRWNGRNSSGNSVSSGIYFARLVTETESKSIRMMLLK